MGDREEFALFVHQRVTAEPVGRAEAERVLLDARTSLE
jgi:hypothetical protein